MLFREFKRRVQEHGLVASDCGNGHWRVTGGKFEVNWWPTSRRKTIYVNGTSRERTTRYGDFEKVLKLATEDPTLNSKKRTGRKKNYTRVKKRKFKKNKNCHWCDKELTLEEATIDHVIPLARGGSNANDNLVISCDRCNKDKGHKIWTKGRRNDDSSNLVQREPIGGEQCEEHESDERQGRDKVQD